MEVKTSSRRVQDALNDSGIRLEVREFPESTRTAAEAAEAIGCEVAQIAKSLIFKAKESERSVLVIASGSNRVDEKKVSRLLGEKILRADPGFVRDKTGFAIGGVPPVAHREAPVTFIDSDLFNYDAIWAAAGTPNAVFPLSPAELLDLTGGALAEVKKE